jgi:phosphoheptose isomerase
VAPPRLERAAGHVAALAAVLPALAADAARIDGLGRELGRRLAGGARCLVAGNGGSAAHAQHLTAELVGRYRHERAPLAAIALHADTSSLTALVNDYPPDDVFARQVEAFGRPGDVLVCLSSSGRSANLVRAAEAARRQGVTVWAMVPAGDTPLGDAADEVLPVASDYPPTVQEGHQVIVHLLAAAVDAETAPVAPGPAGPSAA